MTDNTPPPLGNYDNIPNLDLSAMTAEDITQAMPAWDAETQQRWAMGLAQIGAQIAQNQSTRQQAAQVLATIGAIARSVGLVLTLG